MNWIPLQTTEQLDQLLEKSATTPQVIFKHSIRCSISSMIKNRLERETAPSSVDFHYLDLINYRSLSDKVASDFDITHESPQVLLIKNGKCVYDASHSAITMDSIEAETTAA